MIKDFAIIDDEKLLKTLMQILLENSHLFFKEDPNSSIDLLSG